MMYVGTYIKSQKNGQEGSFSLFSKKEIDETVIITEKLV
jgi:hypothetical protein